MNILFVVDSVGEKCGANVNIACLIAGYMKGKHRVDVLSQHFVGEAANSYVKESFDNVYVFDNIDGNRLSEIINATTWNNNSKFKKIGTLLEHSCLIRYINYYYFENSYLRMRYAENIEKYANENKYDAVIVFCMPHFLADSLRKAKLSAVKGIYQLDPFTFHQMLDSKKVWVRKIYERRWVRQTDFMITTPIILDEFKKKGFRIDYRKLFPQDFPLIRKNADTEGTVKEAKENLVNFFFVGHFYKKIRSPQYLLKLFEKLPNEYVLHLVGGGADEEIENSFLLSQGRLFNHGWVTPTEAKRLTQNADVLVNINNSVTNMLPSKIFEYISTGKPILNICKTENCPTIQYMDIYENAINVIETDIIDEASISNIVSFIDEHRGIVTDYETIRSRFYDVTVEHAGKLIEKCISTSNKC